jgi:formamidopyrimidine-DNA glycosylase
MPELPETETIRKGLEKYVVGHTIESVELIKQTKQFQGDPKSIEGAKVVSVERFGKGLVINLSNHCSLAIHIKLTGQLVYRGKDEPSHINVSQTRVGELPNNRTHIIFHLDRGANLYYNDLRQFGWIKVVKTDDVQNLPFFKELGPEFALHPGKTKLTREQFQQLLSKAKTPIKPLLMDQKKMSGLGNIYTNDALYKAKIDPRRPANSLSSTEQNTLYESILSVLKKGLEEGGSSELTYVNVLGEEGNYQNHTLIYGRQGQKCKRDGTIIKKFMLAGRGTYMCSACQK